MGISMLDIALTGKLFVVKNINPFRFAKKNRRQRNRWRRTLGDGRQGVAAQHACRHGQKFREVANGIVGLAMVHGC